jgi:hypothetical protein
MLCTAWPRNHLTSLRLTARPQAPRRQFFSQYVKDDFAALIFRAIKLICNRVIHESKIVFRFLNKSLKHKLDLGISIKKTYGFKSIDDSIN